MFEVYRNDISITRGDSAIFEIEITDKDKQLINIISQFSNSESKLILVDNVDEFEHKPYYGSQR